MLALGALALLTGLAYVGVWSAGFVFDDPNWIPFPTDAWHVVQRVPGQAPWLLASWLGGGLPWAYHGFVLGLHLVNGLLLWSLLGSFLTAPAKLLTLTLFWLHPIQVESVAYVSGGTEVLLTSYVLLALLLWSIGAWWSLVGGFVAFGLALTLKLSAMALLGLLPVVLRLPPRGSMRVGLVLSFTAALIVGVVWSPVQLGFWLSAHLPTGPSVLEQGTVLAVALWRDLALVVWPVRFSVEPVTTFAPWIGWVALAGMVLAGVGAWLLRHAWPVPFWAWAWIVVLLLPRALVRYQGSPLTLAHLYLPLLAVWVLAGATVDLFPRGVTDARF